MTERITDEPPRGAIGDLRAFQRPGLEGMRRYVRGELPALPVSRLIGMRPTDVGLGAVTFAMPITPWLEDGFGIVWAGVFALFADAPLATALWTGLPAGKVATTSELNMAFVRPITKRTTNLIGRAETIHLSTEVGLSSIRITDQDGRLLAFGSTRCLIADVPVDLDAEYPPPDTGPDDPPDPYLREPPTEGCYFSLDEVLTGVPLENERKAMAGRVLFPIVRTMGIVPTTFDEGHAVVTMPSSPWMSNGGPAIYGGALAWLADFAAGSAVYSTLGPGDVFGTLDMNVRYTRPAFIGSGDLTATSDVRHAGRRLRVASTEITGADGKRIAMATSSFLYIPDGVAQLAKGRLAEEILRDAVENREEE